MRTVLRMPAVLLLLAFLLPLCGWARLPAALLTSQLLKDSRSAPADKSHSPVQSHNDGGLRPLTEEDLRYIMHAGGLTPDGQMGTNSLEALDFSCRQGYRVLELDFIWTADGELVCLHDWDGYYTAKTTGLPRPTLAQFETLRDQTYSFTSLTLDALAQWMDAHPQSYIVTDFKEDPVLAAQTIAARYPHLTERLIVQIYREEEYSTVSALGYTKLIYTLYTLPYAEKMDTAQIVSFVRSSPNLIGLTLPAEIAAPAYLSALGEGGVPLFVHTVDGSTLQQSYFQMGAAGVYTNTGAGTAPHPACDTETAAAPVTFPRLRLGA